MDKWKEIIIQAFENLGGVAQYSDLYEEIIKIAPNEKFTMNNTWKNTVRREIQSHSSDSSGFNGKADKDIFYSVDGIGAGIWGLRDYKGLLITSKELVEDNNIINKTNQIIIRRIIRDTKIIRELKLLHSNKCQICSTQLKISENFFYSEGHHIIPLGKNHNGPDVKENIIIVCPNCHSLLDLGAIKLDLANITLNKLHIIDQKYINYHNLKIFNGNKI